MNRQEYMQFLLKKHENDECSAAELETLYNWLDEMAGQGQEYRFLNEADKNEIKEKIYQSIGNGAIQTYKLSWLRYLSVAAAVLCIVIGVYYLASDRDKEIIVLSTPADSIRKEPLPDGSTIWLNELTQVSYSANFSGNRTIEIKEGEAFFEVKKDAKHPFTVITNNIHTVVKGTSFSVKKITTGDVKVSVVTGKVLVKKEGDTLGFLSPGQRLRYASAEKGVKIDSALSLEANGWINGEILLQNVSLNEVANWLQSHYGIEIINTSTGYGGEYYLQVEKNISIEKVLNILNLIGAKNKVHFILKNKTVIIH